MFRSIRFHYRLFLAFLSKYRVVMITGLFMGMLSFWLFPKIAYYLPKLRTTSRIAVVGRYTLSELPLKIQTKISLGLTEIANWTLSQDAKTYIFKLKPSLYWQDGSMVSSLDLKFNYLDTTVDYPDNQTVRITLDKPYAALPLALSRPLFKTGLIGIGHNKVKKIKKNGLILDKIVLSTDEIYNFYASQNLAKIAFKLGEVDIIEDLSAGDELESWPNVVVTPQVHYDRFVAIYFNTKNFDKNTRQALAYAIDKKRWNPRAIGPISPESWAYNPNVKLYDYDPVKAVTAKKIPQITMTTFSAYLADAATIKADWEKLGIKVEIKIVDSIPSEFETLLIAQAVPVDPDQYHLWHSTQDTNISRLDNKRIDLLLEEGRKTNDHEKRLSIYHDFQKYLLEDLPAIFLYYQTTNTLTRK